MKSSCYYMNGGCLCITSPRFYRGFGVRRTTGLYNLNVEFAEGRVWKAVSLSPKEVTCKMY